ncbi:response regulator transcription factor [Georgenia subflava]|uniref:Response regulator n=1 Tax=Georgenia subflava TaxID=1622177 RepID=A0A6N7EHJ2_9MICO|nr:response regulator transcription factor [Georgenia subflava]MPV36115.1 response regulator [Georgenia subflava]
MNPVRVLIVDDQALVRSGFAMVLSVEDDIEVVGQAADGAQALDLLTEVGADVVLMDVQMPVLDGIAATQRVVEADLAKVIILTTFDREDYLFAGLAAGASGFLLKNADPDDLVAAIRAVAGGHALLSPEVTVKVIARLVAEGTAGAAGAAGGSAIGTSGGSAVTAGSSATSGAAWGTSAGGPTGGSPATPASGAPAGSPSHAPSPGTARPAGPAPMVDPLTAREREVLVLLADGRSNAEIASELFVGEATVKTHVSHILTKIGARDRVQAVVFAYRTGLAGRA